jgi:hypothetical protein
MRWAGHVARVGEGRGVYRVLVGKSGRKRPLWRPRHRWEDNIRIDLPEVGCGCVDWVELAEDKVRMDLQEVGCGCVDWIGLAQDRDRWWALVSAVRNLRVP